MTSKEEKLITIREGINSVDEQILELLAKRRELSLKVVEEKSARDIALRDHKREEELLRDKISKGKERGLDAHYVTRVFHEVIDDSVRLQGAYLQKNINTKKSDSALKVAVQGMSHSSGRIAAEQHFAHADTALELQACATYEECIDMLLKDGAHYALLPIENTISGGINEVYELLIKNQVAIVGEEQVRLTYVLMGLPGATVRGLEHIECTPSSIALCSRFLAAHTNIEVMAVTDPVTSAEMLKSENIKSHGVIAPKALAESMGLEVLSEDVANQHLIFARYLVLARKAIEVDQRIPCKTSLVISTTQEPGALVKALYVFQEHGIVLTKLESRAVPENPREELFYIDFEGNARDGHVKLAIEELTKKARFIKVLGSYPLHDIVRTKVRTVENSDQSATEAQVALTTPDIKPSAKSSSYKLASREYKTDDTVLDVNGVKIGGDNFVVIGGPCSVESREQIQACAKVCSESGARILRGGCFKPRTSPYSFQGLGYEGLDLLVEAGKNFGLPVITEVLAPEDVQRVAATADILQVGARNMQNFSLLNEVGRVQRPVMLKRGMSASITELLQAAEYILNQGNQQVFLCERGIRTFETATRSTLDLSAVPVLKSRTHLPIVVDPSHAAGERSLVAPLAIAAKAIGAHGLMIEFHPKPSEALSDGPQALFPEQFSELMTVLR